MDKPKYELPKLTYGYGDLAPYISEEQLRLHHTKHHQAYVNGANNLMDKIDKIRGEGMDVDMKAFTREMSFHLGGHKLHTAFWLNMAPPTKGGGGKPIGKAGDAIMSEFGSFERFKKEFSQAAVGAEGSGWAALTFCPESNRIGIMQIEKHNCFFPPEYPLLLVLDVWEHAYYLDYKNDRAKFVEGWWNIVDWSVVDKWFGEYLEWVRPAMAGAR